MNNVTSVNGRKFIEAQEGCSLEAYLDTNGTWTIGYGHTAGVHEGMKITQQQADAFLANDLKIAENAINRLVKPALNQHQFDALVSFVYNIGTGAFASSTTLKLLNQRLFNSVPWAMELFKNPNLLPRRKRETALFTNGVY